MSEETDRCLSNRLFTQQRETTILLALPLAAGLLYFWLIGHWFARVLMFLAFAALFGFMGAALKPFSAGGANALSPA